MNPELTSLLGSWCTIASVGLGLLAGFFTAIALFFTTQDSKNKERAMERDKMESRQVVAKLQKENSDNLVRYKELQQRVSWREITKEQDKILRSALAETRGTLNFVLVGNDPESQMYTYYLQQCFENWEIGANGFTLPNMIFVGMAITGDNPQMVSTVREAFSKAGIPFSEQGPVFRGGAAMLMTGTSLPNPDVTIYMGIKPR
ncbi:hypothetical protein TSACC_21722 [Terrimicrobium sacchariphilum]|uniref:Uncharacterized protein n=1 Tax=Terrimicrobium sacchariphilum TaxID=690879 RepID=A0A146G6C7_TERSA|nr:hypothetical protein [Terrimicrobium sacchariphilum]GAT33309.1 hypothetical protein TSACC_21722 [Terrimicrobium sacchariphilum]